MAESGFPRDKPFRKEIWDTDLRLTRIAIVACRKEPKTSGRSSVEQVIVIPIPNPHLCPQLLLQGKIFSVLFCRRTSLYLKPVHPLPSLRVTGENTTKDLRIPILVPFIPQFASYRISCAPSRGFFLHTCFYLPFPETILSAFLSCQPSQPLSRLYCKPSRGTCVSLLLLPTDRLARFQPIAE